MLVEHLWQWLTTTGKDGVVQIVKLPPAPLTLIVLTLRFSLVLAPFGDLLADTCWTPHTLRPTQLAQGFIAFGLIK